MFRPHSCRSTSIHTILSKAINSCNFGKFGLPAELLGPLLPLARGRGGLPAPIAPAEFRAEESINTST